MEDTRSEEERARREYTVQMSKRALIDLCQQEASKFLVQGRYDLAVPGAIQALSFSKDIFGDGSIEMVPPYLLLSEANLGLGQLQCAEEFLTLANWSILKTPACSNAIRSQLHRNFGKLHTAQNKLDEAIEDLSKDIYCSSLEVGPEHIDTSAGYFLVANIFYAQRKVESSLAFYDKVVDIWYKFLASVRGDAKLAENVGEAQLSEGMDMLTRVLNTRVNLLGENHIATGEAKYTLGLLHLFVGERNLALDFLASAHEIYIHHLGTDHASTKDVLGVLGQLGVREVSRNSSSIMRALDEPNGGGGDGGSGGDNEDADRDIIFGSVSPMIAKGDENNDGNSNSNINKEDAGGPGPAATGGIDEGEGEARSSLLPPQDSEASLLSQFPPTQEMPRAMMQSPIPLPPSGESAQATRDEDDDAMRMSPPGTTS